MLNVAPGVVVKHVVLDEAALDDLRATREVVNEWYSARWDDDGSRRARARSRAAGAALDDLQAWCEHPIRDTWNAGRCGRCLIDLHAVDEAATALVRSKHAAVLNAWNDFAAAIDSWHYDRLRADAEYRRLHVDVYTAMTAPALRRAIVAALARARKLAT